MAELILLVEVDTVLWNSGPMVGVEVKHLLINVAIVVILLRICSRGRGRGFNTFNNRGRANAAHVSFCSMIDSRTTLDEYVSKHDPWEFAEFPTFEGADVNNVKLSPLQFMDIELGGIACTALCDTGAQVPVVSRRLVNKCQSDVIGSVCLQGVIGDSVNAPLVGMSVQESLANEKVARDSLARQKQILT